MILLDNREVKKGWDELKSSVTGLFEKHGAEVVSARRWDERRLAFPIKRQQRATYLLMYFNAETPQVQALRREMQFNETVLRNFVISCEKVPEEAFEPEASFDISALHVDDEPQPPSPSQDSGPKDSGKAEDSGVDVGNAAGAEPAVDAAGGTPGEAPVTSAEKPTGDDEEKSK